MKLSIFLIIWSFIAVVASVSSPEDRIALLLIAIWTALLAIYIMIYEKTKSTNGQDLDSTQS